MHHAGEIGPGHTIHLCRILMNGRHVIQYRARKTDEIRIARTLSAFDWLDIADGRHEEANHRADVFLKKKEEKGAAGTKEKEEAGNHVTSNLLIFCLEKEVGGVKWTGGLLE